MTENANIARQAKQEDTLDISRGCELNMRYL